MSTRRKHTGSKTGVAPASAPVRGPIRIIGCGRCHRRDDQIGLRVADLLAIAPPPPALVTQCESPGPDLIEYMHGVQLLILIDAAEGTGGVTPGHVERVVYRGQCEQPDAARLTEPALRAAASSHLLSVRETLKLAEELDMLPPEVWVYVVAARDFGYGDECSQPIENAIHSTAGRIRADVRSWQRSDTSPRNGTKRARKCTNSRSRKR